MKFISVARIISHLSCILQNFTNEVDCGKIKNWEITCSYLLVASCFTKYNTKSVYEHLSYLKAYLLVVSFSYYTVKYFKTL